eukprot:4523570-Pyramimonas_sp.AAC.1
MAHIKRDHDGIDDAQRYATSTYCQACRTEYHTRPRLITHLRYRSEACLEALRQTCQALEDDEVHKLMALDRSHIAELKRQGYHATKALIPARRDGRRRCARMAKP